MLARSAAALAVAVLISLPPPAAAQIRASERGSVSQTVDGTVITVDYARPQIRGRDSVFAAKGHGIVHWGEVWTPGANWATTFEFSKPVTLAGREVPAGKYSVWFVPQPDTWTVHLHRNPRLFHTQPPKEDEYVVSVPAAPRPADFAEEVLLFSFPEVTHTGTTMRMHWGRTLVDLPVAVQPSRPPTNMSAEEMAPYLGSYALKTSEDTAVYQAEALSARNAIRIVVDGWGSYAMELIPTDTPHRFVLAFLRDGELFDVEDAAPLFFDMEGGRAVGFRIIDTTENKPWMTATRTN